MLAKGRGEYIKMQSRTGTIYAAQATATVKPVDHQQKIEKQTNGRQEAELALVYAPKIKRDEYTQSNLINVISRTLMCLAPPLPSSNHTTQLPVVPTVPRQCNDDQGIAHLFKFVKYSGIEKKKL